MRDKSKKTSFSLIWKTSVREKRFINFDICYEMRENVYSNLNFDCSLGINFRLTGWKKTSADFIYQLSYF